MTQQARQRVLLAVLVAVLFVVVWWQLAPRMAGDLGRMSARGNGSGVRSAAARDTWGAELPVVEELRLADLERARGQYTPGRDPFRFGRAATPQPPQADPDATRRRAQQQAQARKPPPQVAPPTPAVPKPPPVDVVFLGSFGPETRRLAVFSDGSEIYNVLEGDVFKERFVVVRIGYESADVGFVGFPDAPAQRLEIGG